MNIESVVFVLILSLLLNCDSLFHPLVTARARGIAMSQLTNTELLSTIQKAIEHHKSGNIVEAIDFYEKALPQLSGNTKASMSGNVGALYMNQGNYERAAHHFSAAVEADGSNPSAHYNLAVVLTTKLGQHAKAIKHCGKAMNLDPENYKAHHLMGNIMQSIGRPAEAEKYFVAAENLALQRKEGAGSILPGAESESSALERLPMFGAKVGDEIRFDIEGTAYTAECVSESPLIFLIDNFISAGDCKHIVDKASGLLEQSFVMGGGAEGYEYAADPRYTEQTSSCNNVEEDATASCAQPAPIDPALYRSSYNAWLPQDPVLDVLQGRLARVLGLSAAYLKQKSEQLQVVRYAPGGQFKPHQDSSAFNSRLVTALLYLNSPAESGAGGAGGETWFPYATADSRGWQSGGETPDTVEASVRTALRVYEEAGVAQTPLPGLKVSPQQGRAVIFFNHLKSGAIDPLAVHAGLPLESTSTEARGPFAEKWVANFWTELDEVMLADNVVV